MPEMPRLKQQKTEDIAKLLARGVYNVKTITKGREELLASALVLNKVVFVLSYALSHGKPTV